MPAEGAERFEVYCIDWAEPAGVATFDTREEADEHADRMDGLSLRCSVRPLRQAPVTGGGYRGPGQYRHYKGGEYEVLGLGLEEATHQKVVIYRPLEGWPADVPLADFCTRRLDDFNAQVSSGEPGQVLAPRFERVNP